VACGVFSESHHNLVGSTGCGLSGSLHPGFRKTKFRKEKTMNIRMKNAKGEFTMRAMRMFAIAIFALSMVFAARSATAQESSSISSCQGLISQLSTDTSNATSLKDKDRMALLSKAGEASSKLDQAKFCDSLQKLFDYRDNLNSLFNAAKPKISPDDYATLSGDVNAAIDCVNNLICSTGGGEGCSLAVCTTAE
jgi:hypothetical protein